MAGKDVPYGIVNIHTYVYLATLATLTTLNMCKRPLNHPTQYDRHPNPTDSDSLCPLADRKEAWELITFILLIF